VSPTGLLEEVIRKELKPLHEKTEALVRSLLGPEALETDIKYCAISIINQCINPIVAKRQKTAGRDKMTDSPPGIEDIDSFADHVARFSLAGIAAIGTERRKERKEAKATKRKTIF
jgi:TetR/AcrR family transcriptional regulator, regulator of cefoperazone and chloramphenicol sensitivity